MLDRTVGHRVGEAVDLREGFPLGNLQAGEIEFLTADEIDRIARRQRIVRIDRDFRAHHADQERRFVFLQLLGEQCIAWKRGGARMDDHQLVSLGNLERVLDGQTVGRRIEHPAVRHQRSGLGEPGRIPERADFALRLVARTCTTVEAIERWGLQEQRFHVGLLKLSAWYRFIDFSSRLTLRPRAGAVFQRSSDTSVKFTSGATTLGTIRMRAPRHITCEPNAAAIHSADNSRSRSGISGRSRQNERQSRVFLQCRSSRALRPNEVLRSTIMSAVELAIAPPLQSKPRPSSQLAISHGDVNVMKRNAKPTGLIERMVRSQRVSRSQSEGRSRSVTSVVTVSSDTCVRKPSSRTYSASQKSSATQSFSS